MRTGTDSALFLAPRLVASIALPCFDCRLCFLTPIGSERTTAILDSLERRPTSVTSYKEFVGTGVDKLTLCGFPARWPLRCLFSCFLRCQYILPRRGPSS